MWNVFANNKPAKDGWYTCTVEVHGQQRYTMDLYWYSDKQRFIDNIRQNVVETYKVISITGEQLHDIGQDRTNGVVAWREPIEPYMDGFVAREDLLLMAL